MPISSTQRKFGPTPGNGVAKDFPFTCKVFAASDIQVIRTSANGGDTFLTPGTDFTVVLNADQDAQPGGTVSLVVAIPAGQFVTLLSAVPITQPTDWQNQGGFAPDMLDESLDRGAAQTQQLAEGLSRAIQAPVTSAPISMAKPQGGQLLAWSEDGTQIINIDPAQVAGFAAYSSSEVDIFTGDGVETVFNLSLDGGSLANLRIAIAGVAQTPGVDFVWNGGTGIEFTEAPADGLVIVVQYFAVMASSAELNDAVERAEAAAEEAVAATATKADKSYVQSVVVDLTLPPYNAVADFNGTAGTDDSAAYLAAGATGRQPDMPEGDYFFGQSAAHRLFERLGSTGPGRFWLNFFGRTLAAGKTFPVGRLVSRLGSDLMGGVLLGAEAFGRGVRLAATRISGPVIIPSDWSYLEWNMYARLPTGKVRRGAGTNKLTYIGAFNLSVAGDLVQPEDTIYVGHTPYLIEALLSDGFTVKNVDGSPVSFADNTAYVYRWCYDVSKGVCNVNGTAVTWVRGEEFFPFSYGAEAHDIQLNGGSWRNVDTVVSNEALTLATSAGTIANATFVLKTRIETAAILRCQSIWGAIEENLMIGVMANGHALVDLQALADADVVRDMGIGIAGRQRFDGNADREHFKMTADGKLGQGVSRAQLEAGTTHLTIGGAGPVGYLGWEAFVDKGDGAGYVRTRFLISAPNPGGLFPGFRVVLLPE